MMAKPMKTLELHYNDPVINKVSCISKHCKEGLLSHVKLTSCNTSPNFTLLIFAEKQNICQLHVIKPTRLS